VCVCSRCNILISGKIIKEMPGSVASGRHFILIYMIIHVFYICFFDVKLPEDDLKRIETCGSIRVLYK